MWHGGERRDRDTGYSGEICLEDPGVNEGTILKIGLI
jgi:hypothetical protein